MPIIKSAKKQLRQNKKKKSRNDNFRALYTEARKTFEAAIKAGDAKLAREILVNKKEEYEITLKWGKKEKKIATVKCGLQSIIDKLVKKNIIHKNNGSRKKSKFVKMMKILEQS